MTETTYTLEYAKSGRSKCGVSKETIEKGELRIQQETHDEEKGKHFSKSFKVDYFKIPPKKFKGVSVEDFVDDTLRDDTEENILETVNGRQDIIDRIKSMPAKAAKAKSVGGDDGNAIKKKFDELKAAAGDGGDSDEDLKPPAKKKVKGGEEDAELKIKTFLVYGNMSNGSLDDVLVWNGQTKVIPTQRLRRTALTPLLSKAWKVLKCIDGHVNGRLQKQCPACEFGRLKLNDADAFETVKCAGGFDESIQLRVPSCSYSVSAGKAPRFQPWYQNEPTEEEKEVMKEEASSAANSSGDEVPQKMIVAVKKLEWPDTSTQAGVLDAAQKLLDVCLEGNVDLPAKKPKQAVGKVINANKDLSAVELLELIVKEYGFAAAKEAKAEKRQAAVASSCTCAANAPLVAAITELANYYFKDGNGNAGGTYTKVVAALSELDYEVTEDNAKGLGKGKTKVANIGKGSADKCYEFVTTGTIAKLEEKRAIHS